MRIIQKYLYYIIIAAYLVLGAYLLFFPKVERYAVLERFSTAGDMRFKYYDMKNGRVLENRKDYPWFFATVADIKDSKKVDNYVKYIDDHKEYVFKITGSREKDDCSYFGNGVCLENIKVKDITAYTLPLN
jgi:hypothetical protein